MPVSAGQPLDPAATRDRLLRAAEAQFYARGVDAVGMSDLAAAAEASKLSIYRHFGSKAGLVHAVAQERSRRVHSWVSAGLSATPEGPERISALFDLLGQWFGEEHFAGCGIMNAAIDTRGAEQGALDVAQEHLNMYVAVFEDNLAGAVAPDDIPRLSRQLLVLLEGATLIAAMTRDPRAAEDARHAAEALIAARALPPTATG